MRKPHASTRRRLRYRRAAAPLVALLIGACSSEALPPQPVLRFAPSERRPAPGLAGPTLDGGRAELSALRGQIVIVNEWASWCGPCAKEAPELVSVARGHANRGVAFLSIDYKDQNVSAAAFARIHGQTWPSIVDHSGGLLLDLQPWFAPYPPNTLVIDRQGRVAARIIGGTTRGVLEALITYTEANP